MKCKECEHFKIIEQPYRYAGAYTDPGNVVCEKHDLICSFFTKKKLDELECVEKEIEPFEEVEG